MLFNSRDFLVFFPVVVLLYFIIPKKLRHIWLLAASYYFYMSWNAKYAVLIAMSTLITWVCGIFIERLEGEKKSGKKKCVLALAFISNLGILFFFKYFDFLLEIINMVLRPLNIEMINNPFDIILPVGISFYTFQSISYLIDMYNDKYPSEKNFFKFLLFVSYFPQLIQGPINRYDKLGVQFRDKQSFDIERTKRALLLILFGLMKKYAIANMLSDSISLILDGTLEGLSGAFIVIGILMYSIQQYADFSGGIDIVMGASEIFGISMMQNFRQPYFATSLGDFWRRWHISLGAWMRDYVFYPFALLKPMQNFGKWCGKHFGTHCKRVMPAGIANILVFFIVGVWHGAELHYVAWGLYNGIIIAISDLAEPLFKKINALLHINNDSKLMHVFRILRTFFIVNIGWYFDRIYNLSDSFYCLSRTFFHFDSYDLEFNINNVLFNESIVSPMYSMFCYCIAIVATIVVIIVSLLKENGVDTYAFLQKRNIVVRWGILLFMVFLFLGSFMFTTSAGGFMYANF